MAAAPSTRASALLLAAVLAAAIGAAAALPSCDPYQVQLGTDKIVLALVGDWGRAGAQDSFFNAYTINQCATKGQCCGGSDQNNNFPSDFDLTDADDAPQQAAAAALMSEVCGEKGCQAVLSLGDNFYPCGADANASGLNRLSTDWNDVYNKYSNLTNLPWYVIVGNHDYGFDGSVQSQMDWSMNNSNWVFPAPYYATSFQGKDFTVQLHSLDTTPLVQSYQYPHPNNAYNLEDFQAKATPSFINSEAELNTTLGVCTIPSNDASYITDFSDNATGQIPWLKSCLNSSTADWNLVQAHFALWGSDQLYGDPSANSSKYYPGMCGGWASIADLVNEYKVDAYINGHDHTMTHSDPNHAGTVNGTTLGYGNASYTLPAKGYTQYFTFGNGGSLGYGDGVTPEMPEDYNNFSSVIYNNNYQGSPGEGFGIATITKCNMTIEMYSIINYMVEKQPEHTVFIPGNC